MPDGIAVMAGRSFDARAMKPMIVNPSLPRRRDDSLAVLAGLFLSFGLLPLIWALIAQLA